MLLRDMGRAGVALIVLGTAACMAEPSDDATPTDDTPPSPTTDSATTTAGGATTSPGAGRHRWHRVNIGFVSAYLLYRSGEAALVDTGVSGSEGAIETALGEIGLGWGSVGHVILTHKHNDHQGSLEAVLGTTGAPWYAGAGDMTAITASSTGTAVGDGNRVFDLEIIETPGHTPGHISVLDRAGGVLVAGDALNGVGDGRLTGANPDFSEDMDLANASVAKLAAFDYEVALFGHGEPVQAGASRLVSNLASSTGG
jgi:glyoxylase-like metal-dependent hydrolase (beta-lactamase superfamily II)